jgi:hypothetical protein
VAALSVVVLDPGRKGFGSGLVAGEDVSVRPFGLQGAVEALYFAVLPGAVGPDGLVFGTERCDRGGYVAGPSVAEVVVGDHAFDPSDPVLGEVLGRPGQKPRTGQALLVGQDLGVGQSGVVVDE